MNISYVKAATNGTLTAAAKQGSINPKLATYRVRVTDETGDLVASFQGMVHRKKSFMRMFRTFDGHIKITKLPNEPIFMLQNDVLGKSPPEGAQYKAARQTCKAMRKAS